MIDGSAAPPGLSREQAENASARRAEVMDAVNSGNLAEYIEQRKVQAMSAFTAAGAAAPAMPAAQPSVADQLTEARRPEGPRRAHRRGVPGAEGQAAR